MELLLISGKPERYGLYVLAELALYCGVKEYSSSLPPMVVLLVGMTKRGTERPYWKK